MANAALIGQGISLAGNVLPRVIGAKKRKANLDAAGRTFQTPEEYAQNVADAKEMASSGDPNNNRNKAAIDQSQANIIARAKAVSGNVGDILSVLSSTNKTATEATLNNQARDTQFRTDARRYLAQTRSMYGNAKLNTARMNKQARDQEFARQSANIEGWAQAANNVASDVVSADLMKKYGYGSTPNKPVPDPSLIGTQ